MIFIQDSLKPYSYFIHIHIFILPLNWRRNWLKEIYINYVCENFSKFGHKFSNPSSACNQSHWASILLCVPKNLYIRELAFCQFLSMSNSSQMVTLYLNCILRWESFGIITQTSKALKFFPKRHVISIISLIKPLNNLRQILTSVNHLRHEYAS